MLWNPAKPNETAAKLLVLATVLIIIATVIVGQFQPTNGWKKACAHAYETVVYDENLNFRAMETIEHCKAMGWNPRSDGFGYTD